MTDALEIADDIGRWIGCLGFMYIWVRFGLSTRWTRYWDTRAIFVLLGTCSIVNFYAVFVLFFPPGAAARVAAAAVTWLVIAGAAVFLVVGFEIEQKKARDQDRPRAEA
jgi:hypothetical protein